MKKRILYNEIIKQVEHKNAIVITGLRQVGKTTLMQQIFNDLKKPKIWFDLDNPLDQKFFEEEDYKLIFTRLCRETGVTDERIFVFLDEIQNLPEITKIVKYLIDHHSVKFFLTGSSNFYMKNLFPESLSGRKFLYKLEPLNFLEYLYFKDIIKPLEYPFPYDIKNTFKNSIDIFDYKKREPYYEDYCIYGGFPEVVVTDNFETKKLILKNIFSSFFEKDLRLLSDYKDTRELRDLILLLVPRTGSMLDVTKLASELRIDRVRTYAHLEFLQGIFLIKLLPKYSKSIDRSVAGGKKVYFADTGLLNILSNINDGQMLENTVINQLCHYGEVSFYNYRNSAEIDAILNKSYGFEIKMNGTVHDLSRLEKISHKLGLNKSFIISRRYIEEKGFIFPQMI